MAITATNKATTGSTSNASSYNTASITPTAGNVVLISVVSDVASGTPNTPTISGCNLTWSTAIKAEDVATTSPSKISLFWGIGNAPSAGAITIDFASQTQNGCRWSVVELTNANPYNPIVQSASGDNAGSGGTLTLTLSTFSDTNNATFGTFFTNSSTETINPGSGFAEIADTGVVDSFNCETEFRNDNDTTVDASRTSGSGYVGGIAVELNHFRKLIPNIITII